MSIQANQGGGVTIFSAGGTGGGGGGTPGGSSGQLQYNASGSFGGMAGTSWDDTNRSLTLTGATVTTSQPVLNLSQTWNAGAVTFTGLILNVTDTASASASLLMDLQAGGSSKFSVRKDGNIGVAGTAASASFGVNAGNSFGFNGAGYSCSSLSGSFYWSDLFLGRDAAASLRLGAAAAAAPVAQTLGVQSVVAGTTNTAGTNFTIKGSAGTGTGAGGSIIFQVAPAGSTGTAQNAFSTALTISSSYVFTFSGSGSSAINFRAVASNVGQFEASGFPLFKVNSSSGSEIYGQYLGFAAYGASSSDAFLYRDAANTLALRNGTSAQVFNVYNTYTDASNYEAAYIGWSANTFYITPTKLGTGANRPMIIGGSAAGSVTFATSGTNRWQFDGSGNLVTSADNAYDIGASGATRPRDFFGGRDMYFGRNLIPTATFATNQTTGFINIPGAAGAPSGVPSNTTGFPLYYDSTNNKIYVYNGSWRSTAALT